MDNLLTCIKVKDKGNEADEAFEDEADEGKGTEDEADEGIKNCLRNPVIVRKILENFSNPELFKLSLVNKLWKYEARSVIRNQGRLIAYVKSSESKARGEEIDAFISHFKQIHPVPFSGISMVCYYAPHLDSFPSGAPSLDPLQGVELDLSLFKIVSVHFFGSWLKNMAAPGVLFAKKLLQDSSAVIEELSLNIASEREDFIQKVFQDVKFPKLKILKLEEDCYEYSNEVGRTLYEQYMKAMMSRAPNLKVLHSNWPINLMLNVVKGRAVLPVYGSAVLAPFEDISEDVIGAIKLERMKLVIIDNAFNFERFNRIAPMLLQKSCTTTLRSVCLDSVLAIPLMSYGISLENVKYLKMDINFSNLEDLDPQILGIIKNFDFSRIFPNLTKVEIAPSHDPTPISQDQISSFIQQANAVLREPLPDRAANVKELYLKQKYLSSLAAQFFVEMFPNIEKLGVKTALGEDEGVPFVCFWENWVNLKELKVRGHMLPASENLDSVFCGIFPEEVAELRKKDEDYLKKVNIVPVMPALTCLKNLSVLWLNNKDWRYAPFQGDATYFFSKVTPLLALARQPTLAVSLKVSSYAPHFSVVNPPAIAHLIPYVSVTSERLKDDEWDRNG